MCHKRLSQQMKRFTLLLIILSKFDLNRSLPCPPYPQEVSPKSGSFVSILNRFSVSVVFSEPVYLQNSAGMTYNIDKPKTEMMMRTKKMFGLNASSVLLQLVYRRRSNNHKLERSKNNDPGIVTIYNDEEVSQFRLLAPGNSRLVFNWKFYKSKIKWIRKIMKRIE